MDKEEQDKVAALKEIYDALALLQFQMGEEEGATSLRHIQGPGDVEQQLVATYNKIEKVMGGGIEKSMQAIKSTKLDGAKSQRKLQGDEFKRAFMKKLSTMFMEAGQISSSPGSLQEIFKNVMSKASEGQNAQITEERLQDIIEKALQEMNREQEEEEMREIKKKEEELEMLNKRLEKLNEINTYSGANDLAEINRKWQELEETNPKGFKYAKTLVWSLTNYFDASRMLSTEMVEANKDHSIKKDGAAKKAYKETQKEGVLGKIWEEVSNFEIGKKAISLASNVAEEVPVIGCIFKIVNAAAGMYFDAVDKVKRHNEIAAITKVTSLYQPDELRLIILKASLNLAKDKKSFKAPEEQSFFKNLQQRYNFFKKLEESYQQTKEKLEEIKNKILGTKINLHDTEEANAAHQDTMIILVHFINNYNSIIQSGRSLDLVIYDTIIKPEEPTKKQEEGRVNHSQAQPKNMDSLVSDKRSTSCCQLF